MSVVVQAHRAAFNRYWCLNCGAETRDRDALASLTCANCGVPAAELRTRVVPQFAKQGLRYCDCYSLAAMTLFQSENIGARLVHGWVRGSFAPNERIHHAWCEFPAVRRSAHSRAPAWSAAVRYSDGSRATIIVVVDYSQLDPRHQVVPREEYYAASEASGVHRYTRPEALREAIRSHHDGPWE